MERTVPVIDAGADKVRQDVIGIGSAEQLVDGHTHALGVVTGQNVAEVAGGDAEIDLVAHLNVAALDQLGIGGHIVDDLRQNAAPVDGVGRGQEIAAARQLCPQSFIREDGLDTGLGVVEVAHHSAYIDVAALLGHHLQLLNLRDAVLGVEHHNPGAVHIAEALQGRLAGVAGGSHQNAGGLLLTGLAQGRRQQIGQHLQGHILKGAGGTVPQLQKMGLVVGGVNGRHRCVVKLAGNGVGLGGILRQLLLGELVQIGFHDLDGPLLVGHAHHGLQVLRRQGGDGLRQKQAAVAAQTLDNGLGGGVAEGGISGADVLHGHYLYFFWTVPHNCVCGARRAFSAIAAVRLLAIHPVWLRIHTLL